MSYPVEIFSIVIGLVLTSLGMHFKRKEPDYKPYQALFNIGAVMMLVGAARIVLDHVHVN